VALAGISFMLAFNGSFSLLDRIELTMAEYAREILVTGQWLPLQHNFTNDYSQAPLPAILMALMAQITGYTDFWMRFPAAVCGMFLLINIFLISNRHFSESFSFWWVISVLGTFIPHWIFKAGFETAFTSLFMLLAVYRLYRASFDKTNKPRNFFLAAIYTGLAVLASGPVMLIILWVCLFLFYIDNRFQPLAAATDWLLYITISFLIANSWLIWLYITGDQDAWIKHYSSFFDEIDVLACFDLKTWLIFVAGFFPCSLLFLKGFRFNIRDTLSQRTFKLWVLINFWALLLVALFFHKFIYLLFIPVTFLSAYVIDHIVRFELKWHRSFNNLLIAIGGGIATLLTFTGMLSSWGVEMEAWFSENLSLGIVLNNDSSGYEYYIGIAWGTVLLYCIYLLFKNNFQNSFTLLFIATSVAASASWGILFPPIVSASQAPLVTFCTAKAGTLCSIQTIGFSSDIPMYYGEQQKTSGNYFSLLYGRNTAPVYIIAKKSDETLTKLKKIKVKELYKDGAYIFYQRVDK
jgi:hypothetical protein